MNIPTVWVLGPEKAKHAIFNMGFNLFDKPTEPGV